MTTSIKNQIIQSITAGFSARLFQGQESYQYTVGIEKAAKEIKEQHKREFKVVQWNRLAGFHEGTSPLLEEPVHSELRIALPMLTHSLGELKAAVESKKLPPAAHDYFKDAPLFDPQDNVIAVIHEADAIMALSQGNSKYVTFMRAFVQSNGGRAYRDGHRGARLLVLLTTNGQLSSYLPELAPIVLDLPGEEDSRRAVKITMDSAWEAHAESKGTKGVAPFTEQQLNMTIHALAGLPYQDREEAVAIALASSRELIDPKTRAITDFDRFLSCIEDEKAKRIRGVPGLTYVPKISLPTNNLPGYAAVDEYIDDTVNIDPAWAKKHNLPPARGILLVGAPGTGKCLAEGTPVLMFDGTIKKVEDVEVGDKLMGPDSKPRKVLSLAHGREKMYQIIPTKGDPYTVNESHILSLRMSGRGGGYKKGDIVNISVRDYLKASANFKHHAKGWRTGVDFRSRTTPLDPYFLGLWLGDGSTNQTVPVISKPDKEIIQYLRAFAKSRGLQVSDYTYGDRCPSWGITSGQRGTKKPNKVQQALVSLGVTGNKHIPHLYKANSRAVRLELLAGLIDTDGSLSSGTYDVIFSQEELADDVVYLARSLGFSAYKSAIRKTIKKDGCLVYEGIYYRLSIGGDISEIPVRINRKKAPARRMNKNVLNVGITVNPVGIGNYYGFEIDGDKLFMLGDFTVTHNTEFSRSVARKAGRMLLNVSLGEIQGGIVGESEANMRRVLSIIRDMQPVVFIDEIDKLGVSSIESGHQGDGGTYSRVIAMLLTAMTDPDNRAIWLLAANRLVSVDGRTLLPAPLIRAGRLDERYYVNLPDAPIRRQILLVQMNRYRVTPDDEGRLDQIAEATDSFVGAELADLVIKATRLAAKDRSDVISTQWMLERAKTMQPIAKQEAFSKELQANKTACSQFKQVGLAVPESTEPAVISVGRRNRSGGREVMTS